jgi:GNAT superfamily N-acetyltransferase
MTGVIVRVAVERDVAQMAQVAIEAFPRDYATPEHSSIADTDFAVEWISTRMCVSPFGLYIVAVTEDTGEVAGYNSWLVGGGRSGVVHSDQTAVRAKYRRQGVGKALKLRSEDLLTLHLWRLGTELLTLTCTCARGNAAMRGLLETTGYVWRGSLGPVYFGAEEVYYAKMLRSAHRPGTGARQCGPLEPEV